MKIIQNGFPVVNGILLSMPEELPSSVSYIPRSSDANVIGIELQNGIFAVYENSERAGLLSYQTFPTYREALIDAKEYYCAFRDAQKRATRKPSRTPIIPQSFNSTGYNNSRMRPDVAAARKCAKTSLGQRSALRKYSRLVSNENTVSGRMMKRSSTRSSRHLAMKKRIAK